MTSARASVLLAALCAAACAIPAPAVAAPPRNDDRDSAQPLGSLPTSVDGTTVDATVDPVEPISCRESANSVWYSVSTNSDARVVVRLFAAGDLDAVVDVYLRQRSQSVPQACDVTDPKGGASLDFQAKKGETYLIRVAQLANSVPGTFTLEVAIPEPLARPPGRPLPRGGALGTLDRVIDTSDAWSTRMRAGTTYRVRLVPVTKATCVSVSLFPPGTRDFDRAHAVRRLTCQDYLLFTPGPGEGGRYSLRVLASRGTRTDQRYRLQVAPAGSDDTAPGIFLRNYARAPGRLRGDRADVVDLYRFDVVRHSDLDLTLDAARGHAFDLVLLNDRGRRIQCICGRTGGQVMTRQLRAGRYFAAVRARGASAGRYVLHRVSRAITSTHIAFGKVKRGHSSPPGRAVGVGVRVRPSVSGPVTVVFERFDPLAGWQFYRRAQLRLAHGRAVASFTPPAVGRWRARATFEGTRGSSPSESGFGELLVAGRLRS